MRRPELSLVIPIYNEEAVLPQLDVRLKDLLRQLGIDVEVVFVNDGSKDKSIELLRRMAAREDRYRVLGFSRNFGHQRAITAGVDKSRGQAVVVMDADLQDPQEVILQMVEKWHAGYDVVYGRRRSREGESWFKLVSAKLFYRIFAMLIPIEVPLDTGDFRLMSRRVVTTMRGLRETHRFVRGLVAWVGFKQTAVEYDRAARAAGETKYPLRKMIAFAIDGIASFSIQPLRLATYFGLFVGTASVLYAIAAVVSWYAGLTVPGWTTTVVLVSFLFSVQFFLMGVLGEYVGRIYEQVKRRPLYIISERINFERRRIENLATQDVEELVATPLAPKTTRSPSHEPPPAGRQPEGPMPIPDVPPPPAALVAAQTATEKQLVASSPLSKRPSKAPPALPNRPAAPQLSPSVANIHAAPPLKPTTPAEGSPSAPPPKVAPKIPPAPKVATKVGASTPPPPPAGKASVPPPAPKAISASAPPPPPKVSPSAAPGKVSASVPPQPPDTTKNASIPPKPSSKDEGPPATTKDDATVKDGKA